MSGFDDMPKLHPRTEPCQKARTALELLLLDWLKEFPDLTWAEAVSCLAMIIASWSKYPVREERRGTTDKK